MSKENFLKQLQAYKTSFPEERRMKKDFIRFVEESEDYLTRDNVAGHVTASAWITNTAGTRVLLVHHTKIDQWLPPGGHADGVEEGIKVALKEAREETGLHNIKIVTGNIFDIDVHTIEAHGDVPGHQHYNLSFHLNASVDEELKINEESKDIKWVGVNEANAYNGSQSVKRLVLKTKKLKSDEAAS